MLGSNACAAIQNYNQAIELNPKYADAFIDRGVAYADLKQFEKAIQDYNQAIELNPKDARILSANSFSNAFIFSLAIMLGSNACAILKSSIAFSSFPSFR
jgi:tetratricopeptide (TPR) repeat protein